MKIECTNSEFANMVRDCVNGSCYACVFNFICTGRESRDKAAFEDILNIHVVNDEEKENGQER